MTAPFDLRQLKSFITVAKCGSFSQAASILCIAQPALSRQVRLLEESLGLKLFVRHSRGVVLTAGGEVLQERAIHLLELASSINEEVSSASGDVTGEVTFGLLPSVAHSLAGDIIKQFREAYPKVSLKIEVGMSGDIQELTEQKKINLAITYEPYRKRNLRYYPLMEEQLYLIGPKQSKIAEYSTISLEEALQHTLVVGARNHGLRMTLENAAESINASVRVDTEVNSLPLQIDLVRRGLAHTILPLASVLISNEHDQLATCPIVSPKLTRRLVLATPADKPSSVASIKLQELVEQVVNKQIRNGDWPGASPVN